MADESTGGIDLGWLVEWVVAEPQDERGCVRVSARTLLRLAAEAQAFRTARDELLTGRMAIMHDARCGPPDSPRWRAELDVAGDEKDLVCDCGARAVHNALSLPLVVTEPAPSAADLAAIVDPDDPPAVTIPHDDEC